LFPYHKCTGQESSGTRHGAPKDSHPYIYGMDNTDLKEKQCEHPTDDWEHDYDPDSILGDAYYCGHCGELMQVG